ncbi:DUF4192 domain-containing protein [Streptomyces oceani]|uniref:DUF4192 domain-containing protein n=1 Tax=Streptomyces oceani TaxID=1075402 RepID=UPI0008733EE4|nr:DUF4192 domain-containing protein [Streptomyces oceani]
MTNHSDGISPDHASLGGRTTVSLRGSAELVDALPYVLGFQPENSIVLVALHGQPGRFGGRLRVRIPTDVHEWSAVSDHLAASLQRGSTARDTKPDGALLFLCRDPAEGASAEAMMERLRPLAQRLRTACGSRQMPVYEALCVSGGRYWSYSCADPACCPPEGRPVGTAGTSVMAAAAAYAGMRAPRSLTELEDRLKPLGAPEAVEQERVLDGVAAELTPRMLGFGQCDGAGEVVRRETLALSKRLMERLRTAGCTAVPAEQDDRDDALLSCDEAARLILGIQDRGTRDQAAEWMEGRDALPALRLWRALVRRCVGAYAEHAVAPLTLAGWVAWSSGDEPAARVAFCQALEVEPDYVFALLLHRACNEGLDPEPLRRCMRQERAARRRQNRKKRGKRCSASTNASDRRPGRSRMG